MSGFSGFYPGKAPNTPVPDTFFSVLLPEIESLVELKVTLHLFWRLAQRKGVPKAMSLDELQADQVLLRSLKPAPGAALGGGLSARGTGAGGDAEHSAHGVARQALRRACNAGI